MPLRGQYIGMDLSVSDLDKENLEYFSWCAKGEFRLQACDRCGLLRYPPTTACPWCAAPGSHWAPVNGKGVVHSYNEVHHAIQAAFKPYTPYAALLVELDTQRDKPTVDEALRVLANLATPNGDLASRDAIEKVGIGSRVRMVFKKVGDSLALPMWTLDDTVTQPEDVWRYSQHKQGRLASAGGRMIP